MDSEGAVSTAEVVILAIQLGMPILVLVVIYFIGHCVEKRHYISIRKREQAFLKLPALSFCTLPPERFLIGVSWDGVFTLKRSIRFWACLAKTLVFMAPKG